MKLKITIFLFKNSKFMIIHGMGISQVPTFIPQGQANNYKKGWKDFYFKPMQQYYNRKNKV